MIIVLPDMFDQQGGLTFLEPMLPALIGAKVSHLQATGCHAPQVPAGGSPADV